MPYILLSSVLAILIWSAPTFAMEIDEHCSVNIMNRTVQVQADGTWRMNNVPSFMGRVRARATCVRDGATTSGQSEFFSLTTNNLTVVEDIFFDDPSPIPVVLTFDDASSITLNNTTTSVDLVVRATYSDGSFSPQLNASNGVNFVSSNPNIVTVDQNGVLTAVSSGRVLITARLEGTVALKQVTATLSGDMDGDGLPDSYEIANGLDPNDAVDALEDVDKDGLNAIEEFTAGTDINALDTDNDGINDGEELVVGIDGFITNPLLADTDGDGFSDGLEVDLATDPADKESFDLANAIESIAITPSFLKLTFNGVDTEVSDHISVVATLIDGTEKNITSSSLGTTYRSSNLAIASFGTTEGEIFGGVAGITTVTATNNNYSSTITVEVERFEPVALSTIDIPGYANNVDVQGDYAYVAAGSAGLVVVDVSDRNAPFIISQLDTDGTAIDLKVLGSTVYLADGAAGIKVIDVSDKLQPTLMGSYNTFGFAQDVALDANYIYVADGAYGLAIINITDPESPFNVAYLSSLGEVKGVAVEEGRLVAVSTTSLHVIDLSEITQPALLSSLKIPRATTVLDVILHDDYAYVAAGVTGYRVVNVVNPLNPTIVGGDRITVPYDLVKQGNLLLMADILFVNAVPYINISEPESAVYQGFIDFSAMSDYNGNGIAADNQFVYFTAFKGALSRLYIGQYRQITDSLGLPPQVNLLSPVASDVLVAGTRYEFIVSAVDDVAVQYVNFYANEELFFTDLAEPYQANLIINDALSELTVTAEAVDWGNNSSSTPPVILSVQSDSDGDGLGDQQELGTYQTDPNNDDSDQDGLDDGREVLIGTDPNIPDVDSDNDGASNIEERFLGSDLINPDTDADGLLDGEELLNSSSPLKVDTDTDGLTDFEEVKTYGTLPHVYDTDKDGISESIELILGRDPLVPEQSYRSDITESLNLSGSRSADILEGGIADDSFFGDDGDDILLGYGGNDSLYGGEDDDVLVGVAGDDSLSGQSGNDVLIGGLGNDTLSGGHGDDTYHYALGDGNDVISGDEFGNDQVIFAAGILSSDVLFQRTSSRALTATIIPTGESITVSYWYSSSARNRIEAWVFTDGVVVSDSDVDELASQLTGTDGDDRLISYERNDTLSGLGGDDFLYAAHGNDELIGGLGNDTLNGGNGDDTYHYALGDGNDVISGDEFGNDQVIFSSSILSSDVLFQRTSSRDLTVTIIPTGERITVSSWYPSGSRYRIESWVFADGVVVSENDVDELASQMTGTDGDDEFISYERNDTLSGLGGDDRLISGDGDDELMGGSGDDFLSAQHGNDQLIGGLGNDTLNGGNGDDTYHYALGDGNDVISGDEFGNDQVIFAAGILSSDVLFQRTSSQALTATIIPTGESITVSYWYSSSARNRIEAWGFADGVVVTDTEIDQLAM